MEAFRFLRLTILCVAMLCAAASVRAQERYEFSRGQWVPQTAPAEGTQQADIDRIRALVDNGKNRQALKQAQAFLKANPDSPLREGAMDLAGQAMMNRGLYYQAFEWYEKQLVEFPNGPLADRALDREYRIGDAFLKGKKRVVLGIFRLPAREEGQEILQRAAEHAPGTDLAERALWRVAEYHCGRGNWADAVAAYDAYLTMFPDRPGSPAAMEEAALATHHGYKGSQWDETPLIEARQRYREFAQEYPLRSQEQGIQARMDQISDQRAQKAFTIADYYRRVDRPTAAAYYYRQVVEYYPDTPWAQQAQGELAKLTVPPGPPGRYGWSSLAPTPPSQVVPPRPEGPAREAAPQPGLTPEQFDFLRGTQTDYPEMR